MKIAKLDGISNLNFMWSRTENLKKKNEMKKESKSDVQVWYYKRSNLWS